MLLENLFHSYELIDFALQRSDPEFVDILSRVLKGKYTSTDTEEN